MPLYEYQCSQCNEKIEVIQKFSDAPLTECKSCGGELKKLITSTSFVLKGSGWYVTDYPSSERKKAIEAKKPEASPKEAKTEKSGENKKNAVNA